MNFYVGQKVVCVDVSNDTGDPRPEYQSKYLPWDATLLTQGNVYVVSWSGTFTNRLGLSYEGISVTGIYRIAGGIDHPFRAARFRPLEEKKTDISIFQAMLTPAPEKVE